MNLVRTLAQVKKLHPQLDHDEAVHMAYEWMDEAAREREEREDTDCIQDHMPMEYFTERG